MIEIAEDTRVADYKRAYDWRKEEGRDMFKTDASMEWFIRRNTYELVQKGALILRGGPGGNLVKVSTIDQAIIEILSRESEARLKKVS